MQHNFGRNFRTIPKEISLLAAVSANRGLLPYLADRLTIRRNYLFRRGSPLKRNYFLKYLVKYICPARSAAELCAKRAKELNKQPPTLYFPPDVGTCLRDFLFRGVSILFPF